MKQHRLVAMVVVSTLLLLVGACGGASDDDSATDDTKAATTTTAAAAPETTLVIPDDAAPAEEPDFTDIEPRMAKLQADDDPDAVYLAALDDLQAFWADTFPTLFGDDFTIIPPERILPIGPDEDSGDQLCQGDPVTYDIVQDNAIAFNCQEGQMVAWDSVGLMKETAEQYGPLASAAILAHEFGHVVQYQSGTDLETPYSELQADCFAGSWVASVSANPPAGLEGFGDPAAADATLSAMITLRDPVGTDALEADAHGTGFDRVRVFQDGFERGAEECAGYADQPPTVTEVPFTDQADADSGGNAPLADLVPLAAEDLDGYYAKLVDGWEPLGPLSLDDLDADTLDLLTGLSDEFGDGAPLVFVSLGWAQTLEQLVGADEGRDATGQLLQQVCVTGDWMAHAFFDVEGDPTYGTVSLSPGDLDEALLGLIQVASGNTEAGPGFTFELISAFRQGVIDRIDSCALDS